MRRFPALVFTALVAIGMSFTGPVRAQTILKLAETATVFAHPDELAAELRAEAVAATAAEAQGRVNTVIAEALARSKAVPGVIVATGTYGVYRIGPQPQAGDKAERWQAGQSLELKSADGAALLTLVGALQKSGLALRQLNWRLSPEASRKTRAEATRQALTGLRGRAEEAAAQVGLAFDGFREIRLDNQRAAPMPRMMAASAMIAGAMASPPPGAEAEDVSVSATAEADILLKPR